MDEMERTTKTTSGKGRVEDDRSRLSISSTLMLFNWVVKERERVTRGKRTLIERSVN